MRRMDEATMERVAKYNIEYQREHGISPSFRTIMKALNLGSLATVQRYVLALERDGRIKRTHLGNIVPLPQLRVDGVTITPLLGEIVCGEPETAVENIEETFALPKTLFGSGELFALRTYGESMTGYGIHEGDLVVIRKQNYAEDGEIVVALVDGKNTLKRLYHNAKKIVLHPENESMTDIVVKECDIQGVLVGKITLY